MITPSSSEWLEILGETDLVNPVPLHTDAWLIEDLSPLWQGADKRGGAGIVIPGANGRRAVPAWEDETDFVLPFTILSSHDADGDPRVLSARETLEANVAYLQAELEVPPDTVDGTRAATLHLPSGATRSGPVIVKKIAFAGLGPSAVRGSITITIPAGKLVLDDGS